MSDSNFNDDGSPTTRRGADTDPSELRTSLPPGTVTFADILGTHQAILGEMVGLRLDMAELCKGFNDLKHQIFEKPSWLNQFMNEASGIASRISTIENNFAKMQSLCRHRHSNGNGHSETILEED